MLHDRTSSPDDQHFVLVIFIEKMFPDILNRALHSNDQTAEVNDRMVRVLLHVHDFMQHHFTEISDNGLKLKVVVQ